MGRVYADVTISWRRSMRVRALVDTGATNLILPRRVARDLGCPKHIHRRPVTLADGPEARLAETIAHLKIDGREGGAVALIVPSGEVLIGVEALETLGLAVDPTKERLVPKRPWSARLGGYRRKRR